MTHKSFTLYLVLNTWRAALAEDGNPSPLKDIAKRFRAIAGRDKALYERDKSTLFSGIGYPTRAARGKTKQNFRNKKEAKERRNNKMRPTTTRHTNTHTHMAYEKTPS